jgi:hypothetical protein
MAATFPSNRLLCLCEYPAMIREIRKRGWSFTESGLSILKTRERFPFNFIEKIAATAELLFFGFIKTVPLAFDLTTSRLKKKATEGSPIVDDLLS